jgi:hypothetical protein
VGIWFPEFYESPKRKEKPGSFATTFLFWWDQLEYIKRGGIGWIMDVPTNVFRQIHMIDAGSKPKKKKKEKTANMLQPNKAADIDRMRQI